MCAMMTCYSLTTCMISGTRQTYACIKTLLQFILACTTLMITTIMVPITWTNVETRKTGTYGGIGGVITLACVAPDWIVHITIAGMATQIACRLLGCAWRNGKKGVEKRTLALTGATLMSAMYGIGIDVGITALLQAGGNEVVHG